MVDYLLFCILLSTCPIVHWTDRGVTFTFWDFSCEAAAQQVHFSSALSKTWIFQAYDSFWQLMAACDSLWQLMIAYYSFWQGYHFVFNCWQNPCNMLYLIFTSHLHCGQHLRAYDSLWQHLSAFESLWQLLTAIDSLQHLLIAFDSLWQNFAVLVSLEDSFVLKS